eukprot:3347036-Pyramimonas_sp.AAC.1
MVSSQPPSSEQAQAPGAGKGKGGNVSKQWKARVAHSTGGASDPPSQKQGGQAKPEDTDSAARAPPGLGLPPGVYYLDKIRLRREQTPSRLDIRSFKTPTVVVVREKRHARGHASKVLESQRLTSIELRYINTRR